MLSAMRYIWKPAGEPEMRSSKAVEMVKSFEQTNPTSQLLPLAGGAYRTTPEPVPFLARMFPTVTFYSRFLATVLKSSSQAKRGRYGDDVWGRSSLEVLRALEGVGVNIEITGVDHFERLATPCVFIANHMSLMETLVLPCLIQPMRRVTFIVKDSLLKYPVFRHVMRSRDPIAVGRTNPRLDLKTVLEGGTERLKKGVSIIVFPQTTRTDSFEPSQFNTIGVKLAQRANVPAVPMALLTDAWPNGRTFKDFGRIDPSKRVHFAFGEPLWIRGRGTEEHQAIIHFIMEKLEAWEGGRGRNRAPEPWRPEGDCVAE